MTEPTTNEILKRAAELCRKDGYDWQETSAMEANDYMRAARIELMRERESNERERR